jgi:hypothetical protein
MKAAVVAGNLPNPDVLVQQIVEDLEAASSGSEKSLLTWAEKRRKRQPRPSGTK